MATWQLRLLGLRPFELHQLPKRSGWTRLHRGVWRLDLATDPVKQATWAALLATTTPPTTGPITWEEAHRAARSGVAVTGLSAAYVRGIATTAPPEPQILIPHSVKRIVPNVRVVRTRFSPIDQIFVGGLPLADPLRMFWDLAWIGRRERDIVFPLVRWMSRADGLRIMRAKDLHEVLRDPAAFRLPTPLPTSFRLAVLRLAAGHSHSGSEHVGRRIADEIARPLGLRVHPRPLPLPDEFNPVAEADIAIEQIRLDIEIDGPHHDSPDQIRRDARRDSRMREELDWTVRRYRSSLVHEDEASYRRGVECAIHEAADRCGVTLPVRRSAAAHLAQ